MQSERQEREGEQRERDEAVELLDHHHATARRAVTCLTPHVERAEHVESRGRRREGAHETPSQERAHQPARRQRDPFGAKQPTPPRHAGAHRHEREKKRDPHRSGVQRAQARAQLTDPLTRGDEPGDAGEQCEGDGSFQSAEDGRSCHPSTKPTSDSSVNKPAARAQSRPSMLNQSP